MEESEKRRERLRAMRTEATDFANPNPNFSPSSSSLSNPLLDKPDHNTQNSTARFGFYTDPMAAFSSDNRRCGSRPLPPSPSGIRNPETPVSGGHQFQSSYSPYQNVHQGGQPYCSPHPPSNPMGWRPPSFVNQGSPSFNSAQGRGHQFNNSPSPAGNPYHGYQGRPNFRSPSPSPIRGCWYNSPYPDSSPGLEHESSPSPGLGRGRGQWDGNNRGSGPRFPSGRGRGFNVDNRACSFYHPSMVEDPWESLKPVIWKGDTDIWSKYNNQGSLHNTPAVKKPRISDPFDKSNSKQSLAEFLSASFDEAVGDAVGS